MKLVPEKDYVVVSPKLVVKKDRTELIGLSNAAEEGELVFQVTAPEGPYKDQLIISSMNIAPSELNPIGNLIPVDTIVGRFELEADEEVVELPTK